MIEAVKDFFLELMKIFHSEHPFYMMASDASKIMVSIWNYKVFITADKQEVFISNIIIGLILFILGIRVVKRLTLLLRKKLSNNITEVGVVNSLERLGYYLLMTIMVVFVLDISNVPLTVFTVVGTTLALGIGLGSQNIVNNFISGIIIMIECPIKVGDIIEVKNIIGKVTNIGARCTSIKTSKNINMLIPNSDILQDVVINWTLEDTILKTNLNLCIASNVSIDKIDSVILDTLDKHPHVLKDPEPEIMVIDFCKNSYDIEVDFWIDLALNNKNKLINDINRNFLKAFKKNKIEVLAKISEVVSIHHSQR